MKGFRPMVKMAKGGMVPKLPKVGAPGKAGANMAAKMPSPPKPPEPAKPPKLPSMNAGTGNAKRMKEGGHVDEKADIDLVKKMVKPACLKDKRMTK